MFSTSLESVTAPVESVTSIDLQVVVSPDVPAVLPEAVTFECGASRQEVSSSATYAYEHHGAEFTQEDPGALTMFFEDLVLGRPLPLKFATRSIQDVDTLVALALFLQRDLAVQPTTPAFVAVVDLVHRRGVPLLGHLDRDLGGFLRFLRRLFPEGLARQELGDRLGAAVAYIRDYLVDGRLPSVDLSWPEVRVMQTGTNGFVLAQTTGPLVEGWVELYRQGHLKGVLLGALGAASLARKSVWVGFDLERALGVLNALEEAAMGLPEWRLEGDFLLGPPGGSQIRPTDLLQLAIRL